MPTTATITPTLGSAPVTLQAGNYSAIDDRRFWSLHLGEGYMRNDGAYQVIQRAAGANMTVDVASSVGDGAVVTGDSVTAQGRYYVPPTAANVNVDIAAADATNPRNDLVVLEVKDDQHDAGGLNLARVRVITGTPNASAALTDAFGSNGTPALPSSCMALAVVRVGAGVTSIATAAISDRRQTALGYKLLGTASATSNFTTSATHTTAQDVTGLSVTGTYAASRYLQMTARVSPQISGGGNDLIYSFVRGSTTVASFYFTSAALSTTEGRNHVLTHVFAGPSAGGTETFKVQLRAAVNNTSVQNNASSTYVSQLTVEDVGLQ